MADTYTLIQRHKGRGIKTWYIRTCSNGKDSYKSTKTTIKAEAMKIFAAYVSERKEESRPLEVGDIDVVEQIGKWMEIQENRFGKDSNTFRLYRSNTTLLREFLQRKKVTSLDRVDKRVAQEFSNEMMKAGKKPSSIEITLRVVKLFFKWMIEQNDLQVRSPFSNVARPKVESGLAEFWTAEECDLIVSNASDEYWAAFFGLQCFAGLRFFEAQKVRGEDIQGNSLIVKQDKTKKDSVIPISAKLKSLLDAIDDGGNGLIFLGHVGRHHSTAAKELKKAVERAGLTDRGRVFVHRLRHSFASNLLRGGVNIRAVQSLGRWSNPKILLKHYAGVIPQDLVDAVNLL